MLFPADRLKTLSLVNQFWFMATGSHRYCVSQNVGGRVPNVNRKGKHLSIHHRRLVRSFQRLSHITSSPWSNLYHNSQSSQGYLNSMTPIQSHQVVAPPPIYELCMRHFPSSWTLQVQWHLYPPIAEFDTIYSGNQHFLLLEYLSLRILKGAYISIQMPILKFFLNYGAR